MWQKQLFQVAIVKHSGWKALARIKDLVSSSCQRHLDTSIEISGEYCTVWQGKLASSHVTEHMWQRAHLHAGCQHTHCQIVSAFAAAPVTAPEEGVVEEVVVEERARASNERHGAVTRPVPAPTVHALLHMLLSAPSVDSIAQLHSLEGYIDLLSP